MRVCGPEEAIGDILKGQGFRAVAWNKLYKRDLVISERYPLGKHHEDEFFTYRILAKAKRLVYVDQPMYAYFQRPGSIMSTFSVKRLDALDAYLERLDFLKTAFPKLYTADKITFCVSCISFFRGLEGRKDKDAGAMKDKIKACRKKVRFTASELGGLSAQQLLYVLDPGHTWGCSAS